MRSCFTVDEVEELAEGMVRQYLGKQREDYAAERGMSISWFIRNFKQYANTTPMQYIVSLRITNAQMLLETTNYNVTEIGNIVGYDNPLYFSRIFKKQKGVSPSEYRKGMISGSET